MLEFITNKEVAKSGKKNSSYPKYLSVLLGINISSCLDSVISASFFARFLNISQQTLQIIISNQHTLCFNSTVRKPIWQRQLAIVLQPSQNEYIFAPFKNKNQPNKSLYFRQMRNFRQRRNQKRAKALENNGSPPLKGASNPVKDYSKFVLKKQGAKRCPISMLS